MAQNVHVFDPIADDNLSKVRGIGRYLQLLKENFPDWNYIANLSNFKNFIDFRDSIFINPFFNFLQPPLTMKRVAKRQIAVIHDLIPLKYPKHFPVGIKGKINIYLNKLALKNYDLIITVSEASKNDAIKILKIEESRVKVIYHCLPHSFINPQSVIRNKTINQLSDDALRITNYCLYVGDVTWNKNLVNLARAIKISDIPCMFVGKTFEKKLDTNNPWFQEYNEFIELTKDDKRFIFKGFVPDYELVKLYQQARVNVLVSHDEGFGFSYLEASQFACPSLLSDIPVFREISNSQGTLFSHPDNPEGIANNLEKVFFDDKLRGKLSLEAQKQAKLFSPEKFKKDWLLNIK